MLLRDQARAGLPDACAVAGISIVLDADLPSASVIAFITAAGAAIAPASPQPFTPSGLCGQGVSVVADLEGRQVVGARHGVVHVGAGQQLAALLVVDRILEQRLADALGDAAMDLALDDHRVDDVAEIVDRDEVHDLDDAGVGIDLDLADMRAGRIGEVRRIVERRSPRGPARACRPGSCAARRRRTRPGRAARSCRCRRP